jgi:hypothetical protein
MTFGNKTLPFSLMFENRINYGKTQKSESQGESESEAET